MERQTEYSLYEYRCYFLDGRLQSSTIFSIHTQSSTISAEKSQFNWNIVEESSIAISYSYFHTSVSAVGEQLNVS